MEIGNLIQLGILFVAIAAIVFSQWSDRKQRKLEMYAEYTRRYEDLFRNMPDDIYNGTTVIDDRTKKHMRFYFNLCNEEYHLWQDGFIKEKVWELWVEGMQIETQPTIYKNAWDAIKKEYNPDFRSYFEENVINKKYETK